VTANRWDSLHPATRASIELQDSEPASRSKLPFRCGCEADLQLTHVRIWLCVYHQGYDDGAKAAAERLARYGRVDQ
jgi:hypothetical protein